MSYKVFTEFVGVDKISSVFQQMEQSAQSFGRKGSDAFDKVTQSSDHASNALRNATKHGYNFGAVMKGILAAHAIRYGIGMVSEGVHTAAREFLHFDDAVVDAAARFQDIGPKATNFAGKVTYLKGKLQDLASGTKYSPQEAAEGFSLLAQSIPSSEAALKALIPVMNLNVDAMGDLRQTAEDVGYMMGAWNLRTGDIAKDAANMKHIADVLARAKTLAPIQIGDMIETMKTIGPVARLTNQTMEDSVAIMVLLGRAGIKGTEAATGMKNFLMNLTRPEQVAILKASGVAVKDYAGKVRKGAEILRDVDAVLGKHGIHKGDLQYIQAYQRLLNIRAIPAATDLTQALSHYEEIRGQIANAGGFSEEIARKKSEDLLNSFIKVGNAALTMGNRIFDAFAVDGKNGADILKESLDKFDVRPVVEGLQVGVSAFKTFWGIASHLVKPVALLVGGFYSWKVLMMACSGIGWVLSGVATGLEVAFTAIAEAFVAGVTPLALITDGFIALSAVAMPLLLALGAGFAVGSAGYSLFTGNDNVISEIAQKLGLVPKLDHDENGHIIDKSKPQPTTEFAPNQKSAGAKAQSWGQAWARLEIAGAPPGSSLTQGNSGLSAFDISMMGANPTGARP